MSDQHTWANCMERGRIFHHRCVISHFSHWRNFVSYCCRNDCIDSVAVATQIQVSEVFITYEPIDVTLNDSLLTSMGCFYNTLNIFWVNKYLIIKYLFLFSLTCLLSHHTLINELMVLILPGASIGLIFPSVLWHRCSGDRLGLYTTCFRIPCFAFQRTVQTLSDCWMLHRLNINWKYYKISYNVHNFDHYSASQEGMCIICVSWLACHFFC